MTGKLCECFQTAELYSLNGELYVLWIMSQKKDKAALGKGKKVIGDAILYSVVRMPQRSGASFIWRSEGIEGVKYGNV